MTRAWASPVYRKRSATSAGMRCFSPQQHAPQQAGRGSGEVRLQGAAQLPPQGQDEVLAPPDRGPALDAQQLVAPVRRGGGVHPLQVEVAAEVEGAGVARRLGPPQARLQPDAVTGAGGQPEAAQGHPHPSRQMEGVALGGDPALGLEDEPRPAFPLGLALLRFAHQPAHQDAARSQGFRARHVVRRPQSCVLVVAEPSRAGGQRQQADRGREGRPPRQAPRQAQGPHHGGPPLPQGEGRRQLVGGQDPGAEGGGGPQGRASLGAESGHGESAASSVPRRLDPVHPPRYIGAPCSSACSSSSPSCP